MGPTGPQKKILRESGYDNPRVIDFKVEQAMGKARELEGWDVFATSRESNLKLLGEDVRTVAARFWEKERAFEWIKTADPDLQSVRKWNDERFNMPCFLAMITYKYPHYDEVKDKFDRIRHINDTGGLEPYPGKDDEYWNQFDLNEADARLRAGQRYDQDYDQIEATRRASTRAGHAAPDFRDVGGIRPGNNSWLPYAYIYEWPEALYLAINKIDHSKRAFIYDQGEPGPWGMLHGRTSKTGLYHAPWFVTIHHSHKEPLLSVDMPWRDKFNGNPANQSTKQGYLKTDQAQDIFNYFWKKYGPPSGV